MMLALAQLGMNTTSCGSKRPAKARTHSFMIPVALIALLSGSCGKKPSAAADQSSKGSRVKWTVRSAGTAVSHPAIAPDGTIYVGSSAGVQAFSPAGTELWKVTLGAPQTPVIDEDGTLYFGSRFGLAFGVSSQGKIVWQSKIGMIGINAPPALGPGPTLYFVNTASDLYALRPKQSDSLAWSLQTFREGLLSTATFLPGTAQIGYAEQHGAPVLFGEETLYLPRQNFLHTISSSGNTGWYAELSPGDLSMAALGPDGTIYVGDDRSLVYAVDPSGTVKWRFESSASISSPVVDTSGVIYFCDGDALYAVSPDGTLKWRYSRQQQPHFTSPPTLAADGTIYVGQEFGLMAFSSEGKLKWTQRVYTPTSPLTIAPDGTVYFGCGYFWLCAVQGENSPLMQSSWPKPYHDLANTSRVSTLHE
jgi:outer membrane protein assembly factor BamB